ncbi:MAG: hypothetical protein AAF230_01435 [Pseudomonadota bacterium]
MTRFTKIAFSGLTALSLALTPMSAAAADRDDVAKALAGLAVLGIIAAAANDRDNNRNQRVVTQSITNRQFGTIGGNPQRRVIRGEIIRPGHSNKRQARRAALPDQCLRIIRTSRGNRAVYGARCLSNNFAQLNRLPRACKAQVRTNNRIRQVYTARCLRRDGWQVARF